MVYMRVAAGIDVGNVEKSPNKLHCYQHVCSVCISNAWHYLLIIQVKNHNQHNLSIPWW